MEKWANSRRERQQRSLPWDPDLEEASVQPSYLILLDPHFVVYHQRTSSVSMPSDSDVAPQHALRPKSLELLCV